MALHLGLGLVLHLRTQAERRCLTDSSFLTRHSGVPAIPSSCWIVMSSVYYFVECGGLGSGTASVAYQAKATGGKASDVAS